MGKSLDLNGELLATKSNRRGHARDALRKSELEFFQMKWILFIIQMKFKIH